LHVDNTVRLENNIIEMLRKLERVFPPTFFNVIEHLPIHLPRELIHGGPVYNYKR